MTQPRYLSFIFIVSALSLLSACVTTEPQTRYIISDEMQRLALCQSNEQSISLESKIRAEYGFKRFAKNTYRPVIAQQLFGHEVRVIEINDNANKLYVAGNPQEFRHHFQSQLPDISCENKNCQAPLNNGQSLFIYKANHKKSKDTTVIECTKASTP